MLPRGVYPASVTPFDGEGRVDEPGLVRLLAWFRHHGCAGVVLGGTTGEGPSLSAVEKRDLIRLGVRHAEGVPIIAGVASPSLEEAIWLCAQAGKSGAVAALVMPPAYFTEAGEEGIERWFTALLDRSPLPVLLYNFPQRCGGVTLGADLVVRLATHERFAGLKDSSGDRANLAPYAEAAPGRSLFVGDETLLLDALAAGWSGTISGAANVLAPWLKAVVEDDAESRASAEAKFRLMEPALRAMRTAPQPGTSKALLGRLGVLENLAPRLPLLPPDQKAVDVVWEAVRGVV